jgi:hypothetical protein
MNERLKAIADEAQQVFNKLDENYDEMFERFATLLLIDTFAIIGSACLEGDDSKTDEIIDDRLQDAAGDVVDAYGIVDRIY